MMAKVKQYRLKKRLCFKQSKNPVLSDINGFDGRARIYNIDCHDDGNYAIPSRISFEFASWYRNKDGTAARGFIELLEESFGMENIRALVPLVRK
jgi:hypothetical protein